MCTLKAIRCWLKLKTTESVPKGWQKKREEIYNRIENFDKKSICEATIEEIDDKELEKVGLSKPEVIKSRERTNMVSRIRNSYEAIKNFDILRRKENEELQNWKSYPGLENIVRLARDVVENNARDNIVKLIEMMKSHESQQTAPIIATIAMLIGSKLKDEVTREIRISVGDIISWDVPIIKHKKDWPQRK